MRSVSKALVFKTVFFYSFLTCFIMVSGSPDKSIIKDWKWYGDKWRENIRINHENHLELTNNKDGLYPRQLTRLIAFTDEQLSCCKYSSITASMWTKLWILFAFPLIFYVNSSSELQLVILILLHMDPSTATGASSVDTSHMGQTSEASHNYYARGVCDLGWYQYSEYCYRPVSELKIFDHAQRACAFHSANLLSISSHEENIIAYNISKHFLGFPASNFIWLGMERRKSTRQLHWVDGIHMKYENWIIGEPDSNGACVQMISKGLWEDTSCYHKMPFICKKQGLYALPYSRTTELGIMVGIPFIFIVIVIVFVGMLIYKSIKDADDTFFGYGKNRNREKMHAALVDLSTSIAHVKTQPTPRPAATPNKKASRSNSSAQSVSSSHVNKAVDVSDSPVKAASGNGRLRLDERNKEKPADPEHIEMHVRGSVFSIDSQKDDPPEIATSQDHLVTLKPKSRRLKGARKDGSVQPPVDYRLKTYV